MSFSLTGLFGKLFSGSEEESDEHIQFIIKQDSNDNDDNMTKVGRYGDRIPRLPHIIEQKIVGYLFNQPKQFISSQLLMDWERKYRVAMSLVCWSWFRMIRVFYNRSVSYIVSNTDMMRSYINHMTNPLCLVNRVTHLSTYIIKSNLFLGRDFSKGNSDGSNRYTSFFNNIVSFKFTFSTQTSSDGVDEGMDYIIPILQKRIQGNSNNNNNTLDNGHEGEGLSGVKEIIMVGCNVTNPLPMNILNKFNMSGVLNGIVRLKLAGSINLQLFLPVIQEHSGTIRSLSIGISVEKVDPDEYLVLQNQLIEALSPEMKKISLKTVGKFPRKDFPIKSLSKFTQLRSLKLNTRYNMVEFLKFIATTSISKSETKHWPLTPTLLNTISSATLGISRWAINLSDDQENYNELVNICSSTNIDGANGFKQQQLILPVLFRPWVNALSLSFTNNLNEIITKQALYFLGGLVQYLPKNQLVYIRLDHLSPQIAELVFKLIENNTKSLEHVEMGMAPMQRLNGIQYKSLIESVCQCKVLKYLIMNSVSLVSRHLFVKSLPIIVKNIPTLDILMMDIPDHRLEAEHNWSEFETNFILYFHGIRELWFIRYYLDEKNVKHPIAKFTY